MNPNPKTPTQVAKLVARPRAWEAQRASLTFALFFGFVIHFSLLTQSTAELRRGGRRVITPSVLPRTPIDRFLP